MKQHWPKMKTLIGRPSWKESRRTAAETRVGRWVHACTNTYIILILYFFYLFIILSFYTNLTQCVYSFIPFILAVAYLVFITVIFIHMFMYCHLL